MLGCSYSHVNAARVLMIARRLTSILLTSTLATAACSRVSEPIPAASRIKMTGPLIAASATMVAAWEFPRNPIADASLDKAPLSEEIRRGFRLFTKLRTLS